MKKFYLIIVIIIILISFNSMICGADLKIGNKNINFDISPNELNDNSYIPIKQLKNMDDFYYGKLTNDKHLIIYKNNFYMFTFDNNVVKSSKGNIQLENNCLQINDHVLIPFEFVKIIFKDKIIMNDKMNNKGKKNKEKFHLRRSRNGRIVRV